MDYRIIHPEIVWDHIAGGAVRSSMCNNSLISSCISSYLIPCYMSYMLVKYKSYHFISIHPDFSYFFPSNRGVKSGPWWLDVTPKYPRYFPTMFDGNPSLSISIHANHHVFSREFLSTTPLQSHHPCMYRMYTLFDC